MTSKLIVLVSDRDDPKHGEITVLEDIRKAERLVETLLEAGFEQERIYVFRGSEMEMQVNHRPVVSLACEGSDGPGGWDDSASGHKELGDEEGASNSEQPREEASAEAYTQGGIRFSSLFRRP